MNQTERFDLRHGAETFAVLTISTTGIKRCSAISGDYAGPAGHVSIFTTRQVKGFVLSGARGSRSLLMGQEVRSCRKALR